MTSKAILELAISKAIQADLRGEPRVKELLKRINKKYQKLSEEDKEKFDKEKLVNPYPDSRLLVDNNKGEIKKILAGIDMEVPELLLAKELKNIDLVLSHHPEGQCLADLSSVMQLQAEVLAVYGLPINIAEAVTKPRIIEVSRGVSGANHFRSVDTAKLLQLDYACTHTTADNLSAKFIHDLMETKKPEYVEDVLKLLEEIPEYKQAQEKLAGPMLFAGSPENSCGKIVVTEFTGGTSGSKDVFEKMAQYGFGTILGMHMSEEHRKEAEKYHLNVIIAGHMSSDSLGMNLFLDGLEKKGIEVITTSGLIRVKRF